VSRLDKLFRLIEVFTVLAILAFAAYLMCSLLFGPVPIENTRAGQIIILLNDNWKVMLLILAPLFYRAIRTFIEEVREIGGVKRQQSQAGQRKLPKKRCS
jgi:ABC-type transport system involved in cytochrome c biogenesis permease subunit